jgi:cytochrome c-type biogenesis protein CcmH
MLGKSYAVMGRFDDAVTAYAEAARRAPDNPNVLADYAEALAMSRGQSLQGEPETLALRALKLDPNHLKALALAGSAAMDRNDGAAAARYWEKLATLIPPGSEMARDIAASIAEARALPGATAGAAANGTSAGAGNLTGFSGISGTVTLAPALAARAAPGDTVFVFARAAAGPRMPLAILRKKVSDLPLRFTLDDSTAMSPAARLSGVTTVVVGARISKSGNALPAGGDLQGMSAPLAHDSKGVAIIIDGVVP